MIVECVPNISEGRDTSKVESIADAVRGVPGVTLMNLSSDADHNRSVISFLGEPTAVACAAVKLAGRAVGLIDLTNHRGEHPRMGAVDVIPFIPLRDVTMEKCVELSRQVAMTVYDRYGLPSYLYERSATAPHRVDLASVRRGQFEGMAKKMQSPGWAPDFGSEPHPTAGVVAIGARPPLVAFNINLDTPDAGIASAIAKTIRQSGGGYECVKAIGIYLEKKGAAQVSLNMTDCEKTPLHKVLETVRAEAKKRGANVTGTELIGLSPMNALLDSAAFYLQIEGFNRDNQVIEKFL